MVLGASCVQSRETSNGRSSNVETAISSTLSSKDYTGAVRGKAREKPVFSKDSRSVSLMQGLLVVEIASGSEGS